MNKYIIPVCDIQSGLVWNEIISSRTINECQDKLIQKFIDKYDLEEGNSYREFVEIADKNDILIGTISDLEEL